MCGVRHDGKQQRTESPAGSTSGDSWPVLGWRHESLRGRCVSLFLVAYGLLVFVAGSRSSVVEADS